MKLTAYFTLILAASFAGVLAFAPNVRADILSPARQISEVDAGASSEKTVAVSTARIVAANYPLLRRDFSVLKDLSEPQVDAQSTAGEGDPKSDKPWNYAHDLAKALAEGADRTAFDRQLQTMLSGYSEHLQAHPGGLCRSVFSPSAQ